MSHPKNPFKFGTVVDGDYFTNRSSEIREFTAILNSENHLILIGPRRFGKTSVIRKIISESGRPVIYLDAMMLTSPEDFTGRLLSKAFRLYPFERITNLLKQFRVVPSIKLNPLSGDAEVSFSTIRQQDDSLNMLEDALNLIEKLSRPEKKLIVVIDEFQEILNFGTGLDRQLRSVIQHHQNINYVLTGSQESLMRSLFEDKKSPFYHFGLLRYLDRIPDGEFMEYLTDRFGKANAPALEVARHILDITEAHPYYTQQLAWQCWEILRLIREEGRITTAAQLVQEAAMKLTLVHDLDFDRLWSSFGTTGRKILTHLSSGPAPAVDAGFLNKTELSAASTAYSALRKLSESGIIIKSAAGYQIDDPFFARWIQRKRQG